MKPDIASAEQPSMLETEAYGLHNHETCLFNLELDLIIESLLMQI